MECVYCNNDRKPTKEHVIPDSFIRRMDKKTQITWLDKAPSKVIGGDITVKDVCSECNNGTLSKLDDYAVNLITGYNGKINMSTNHLFFKYNFDFLSRWLLKVCYNSARANNSESDINLYKKVIEYILKGEKTDVKFSIFGLFMDLRHDRKEVINYNHFDVNSDFSIDFFRIAPFTLREIGTYKCALRTIMINSFAFLIVIYGEENEDRITEIENYIKDSHQNLVKLNANMKKVKLRKDKIFWSNSLITSANLHDKFLTKRKDKDKKDLYVITITKKELISMDYSQIQHFIGTKMQTKEDLISYYQRFEISIDGYNDDKRELYHVPEFQVYIRKLIQIFPEIVWYLDLSLGFFPAIVCAYVNTNNFSPNDTRVQVNPEKVQDLMCESFMAINKLTNQFALDDSYNDKVTKLFKTHFFKILNMDLNTI
ncbi:hypothetical protein P4629_06250 [Priestia aryabhattai]|uniref:hypothetical protein n=1 Tax=Priestia aryabhattai TaxID=412384 RepID=UPI002E23B29E|nr:hypothetical protein [Priestia aryabhattai]